MGKLSAKSKIYILCAVWVALVLLMFLYLFNILDASNQKIIASFSDQQYNLNLLQAQQASYKLAQDDLDKVTKEQYTPDQLFSKDVTLVNEVKTLEDLGTEENVQLTITGLSGTLSTLQQAPSQSQVYQVPYNLMLQGTLDNCLAFMERLEHLQFITSVPTMSINSIDSNTVEINLNAYFYLRNP